MTSVLFRSMFETIITFSATVQNIMFMKMGDVVANIAGYLTEFLFTTNMWGVGIGQSYFYDPETARKLGQFVELIVGQATVFDGMLTVGIFFIVGYTIFKWLMPLF